MLGLLIQMPLASAALPHASGTGKFKSLVNVTDSLLCRIGKDILAEGNIKSQEEHQPTSKFEAGGDKSLEIIILCELIIIAVLFVRAVGNKIAAEALVLYIKEKEYTPPSEDETRECVKKVVKRKFKIRSDS